MGFLYTKSIRFISLVAPEDAELLAVLSQNIGADDMGVGRRIVSKVFFQRLFLFKGQMALAPTVVIQTEKREPFC